jgi:protein-S-isoprenylcysteine O-methyltransferase Ste14
MLDEGVLVLLLLNFVFIGLLPIVFFKRGGRLTGLWWLTAMPFILCPVFLLAAHLGIGGAKSAAAVHSSWGRVLAIFAVPMSAGSIALIAFTLGTHRVRIALWHQTNDAPASIVTYGAYRRIRHPFYAAFLLALFASLVYRPHPITLLTFSMGLVILNLTAAREEQRLTRSQFGGEYAAYAAQTGRFLPRWTR